MNSMIVKLTEINKRYVELNDLLVSDEIISKPKEIITTLDIYLQ